MHELYELKDKLMNELEAYNENGKFSKDDAEAIKALSASIEHICNIIERDDEDGYSGRDGRSYARGGRGYSREGGRNSYVRGRMNARRDSMGRYSRDDGMDGDIESVKRDVMELAEKVKAM